MAPKSSADKKAQKQKPQNVANQNQNQKKVIDVQDSSGRFSSV